MNKLFNNRDSDENTYSKEDMIYYDDLINELVNAMYETK